MKATCSIIIAILAATSQISSTFAQAAVDDTATTSVNRFVVINLTANDLVGAGVPAPADTPIVGATQPVIVPMTGNGVTGAGTVSEGFAAGTVLYTPAPGFTGVVTFTYMIPDCSNRECGPNSKEAISWSAYMASYEMDHNRRNLRSSSNNRQLWWASKGYYGAMPTLTGTVTVTVLAEEIRPDFRFVNQFSTKTAVNLVNQGITFDPVAAGEAIRLAANGGV
jgi:hypothetical protein